MLVRTAIGDATFTAQAIAPLAFAPSPVLLLPRSEQRGPLKRCLR
jgi:hypothetical protein